MRATVTLLCVASFFGLLAATTGFTSVIRVFESAISSFNAVDEAFADTSAAKKKKGGKKKKGKGGKNTVSSELFVITFSCLPEDNECGVTIALNTNKAFCKNNRQINVYANGGLIGGYKIPNTPFFAPPTYSFDVPWGGAGAYEVVAELKENTSTICSEQRKSGVVSENGSGDF